MSLEPLQGRRATPVPPHSPSAVGLYSLRRLKWWFGKRCSGLSLLSLLWFPLEASSSSSSWILAQNRTLQFHPNRNCNTMDYKTMIPLSIANEYQEPLTYREIEWLHSTKTCQSHVLLRNSASRLSALLASKAVPILVPVQGSSFC